MHDESQPILDVRNVTVSYWTERGSVRAVDDVSFQVPPCANVGIVGESGSGKSTTMLSVMRLIRQPDGQIESGKVWFRDRDLLAISEREMRAVRGNKISMVFQEPMTSLNPVYTVGFQIAEALRVHRRVSRHEARSRAEQMLELVCIPSPANRMRSYPHELSGGMRQRVMIAMALVCDPEVLLTDEPTTALDVTVQAQILDLLRRLQERTKVAIVLVTHDLGLLANFADQVIVMYAGQVVETAPVQPLFADPRHPYTRALLQSARAPFPSAEDRALSDVLPVIPGKVPDLAALPPGCRFQNRCPWVADQCRAQAPPLMTVSETHRARCWFASRGEA